MIRRADITVKDDLGTPEGGVYITVKDEVGDIVPLYNDDGTTLGNPFQSDVTTGGFAYNVESAGTYIEEYRLSLSEAPNSMLAMSLVGQSTPVVPEQFRAVGDGLTDDHAALQAALNTGRHVWLQPGITYAFGSQLTPPSGGGFIGRGKLLMLTGTGQFDHADYAADPLTYSGVFAEGKSDITIEAQIEMQANAGIRTCNAIWVRNCSNVNLDVEAYGFKEARYGIVEWNSNIGGSVRAYVHDCTTNTTALSSMQITALSVDSNRYDPGTGPINSIGLDFAVQATNIYLGSIALATYGEQTDGVNLQGSGYAGHKGTVIADNVYEPLDMWTDGNVVEVVARNCFFGAKVIYGASDNIVHITANLFQKNALYLGGATVQATSGNRCYVTAMGGGQIGTQSDVAAVAIEGGSTFSPDRNYVEVSAKGDGINLDYGALISNGATNNTVELEVTGAAVAHGEIGTSAGAGNVIKRSRPSLVRANLSANTVYANLATIIFNTETIDRLGEYNPATGIWTATNSGTIRVTVKGSLSVGAGLEYGSYIQQNSTVISHKRNTNGGATGATMDHDNSAIIQVAPGDTVFVRNDDGTGAATATWFGGASTTFLEIEER